MFRKIMAAVDLRHKNDIAPSLDVASGLAKTHGATLVYVGIGSGAPGELGHTASEFARALDAFAAERSEADGLSIETHAVVSHDPAADLDKRLMGAISDLGADLVVMQTHRPGWADHWFGSHGGHVAANAPISVMLVR